MFSLTGNKVSSLTLITAEKVPIKYLSMKHKDITISLGPDDT